MQQPSAQSAQTAARNLSSRFAWAAGLMDGYMRAASDALEAGLDSARGFLDRAERQSEIPQKALNR